MCGGSPHAGPPAAARGGAWEPPAAALGETAVPPPERPEPSVRVGEGQGEGQGCGEPSGQHLAPRPRPRGGQPRAPFHRGSQRGAGPGSGGTPRRSAQRLCKEHDPCPNVTTVPAACQPQPGPPWQTPSRGAPGGGAKSRGPLCSESSRQIETPHTICVINLPGIIFLTVACVT